jgi:hypothetical protein
VVVCVLRCSAMYSVVCCFTRPADVSVHIPVYTYAARALLCAAELHHRPIVHRAAVLVQQCRLVFGSKVAYRHTHTFWALVETVTVWHHLKLWSSLCLCVSVACAFTWVLVWVHRFRRPCGGTHMHAQDWVG